MKSSPKGIGKVLHNNNEWSSWSKDLMRRVSRFMLVNKNENLQDCSCPRNRNQASIELMTVLLAMGGLRNRRTHLHSNWRKCFRYIYISSQQLKKLLYIHRTVTGKAEEKQMKSPLKFDLGKFWEKRWKFQRSRPQNGKTRKSTSCETKGKWITLTLK